MTMAGPGRKGGGLRAAAYLCQSQAGSQRGRNNARGTEGPHRYVGVNVARSNSTAALVKSLRSDASSFTS